MNTQAEIRQQIQAQRQALSKTQQADFSTTICQQIIDSGVLDQAKHIAFYLPVRGEADPTSLRLYEAFEDKQFYLPILSEIKENHLAFAAYNDQTPMKLNRFKIPEPDIPSESLLHDPLQLDVVIMPLVGIDKEGNRIGMGGGFYDRTFSFKKKKKATPVLVAFAYDFQLIEPQTPQNWDVPVDMIASQSNFQRL